MPKGLRLDQIVVERGLVVSREAARTAIMSGAVLVNGEKITKPGVSVALTSVIELTSAFSQPKFASRGGLKLEKALEQFHISVSDRICIDIGASTGGFTDCLLKSGASRVYAVDVGYGQLEWSLRNDPRVVVKERLNARNLTAEDLYAQGDARADLVVVDVSFISIAKVLPKVLQVTTNDEKLELILLVKPQFEAGRELVGKGGVVRSEAVHVQVLQNLYDFALSSQLTVEDVIHSPIKGPAGNIEFLMHLKNGAQLKTLNFNQIVQLANLELSPTPNVGVRERP